MSAMRLPHPLLHKGLNPYVATQFGWGRPARLIVSHSIACIVSSLQFIISKKTPRHIVQGVFLLFIHKEKMISTKGVC